MWWIIDCYRLVRFIKRNVYRVDQLDPPLITNDSHEDIWILEKYMKHNFISKYKKINISRTNKLLKFAYEKSYLGCQVIDSDRGKIKVINVDTAGYEFTDTFLLIPFGLINALFKKYGRLLSGIGIGSLLAVIFRLITWIIRKIADIILNVQI